MIDPLLGLNMQSAYEQEKNYHAMRRADVRNQIARAEARYAIDGRTFKCGPWKWRCYVASDYSLQPGDVNYLLDEYTNKTTGVTLGVEKA